MSKRNRSGQSGSETEPERQDRLELAGHVEECLPGTLFRVVCDNGHQVLCTLGGRLRLNRIRILPGDNVRVEVSPYDLSRGRVVYRN
jgi:translation initiation factor IF-1